MAVVAGLVLAGCSAEPDAEVRDAVEEFEAALAADDGATACRLLADATVAELESSAKAACDQAVLEEVDPSPAKPVVEVYGDAAQARVGGDTAFLARYPDGWRILAVGCTPPKDPDLPYDCDVQGG